MADPRFYLVAGPFNLRKLATAAEAEIGGSGEPEQAFLDVRPLAEAGPEHVSFLDNKLYVDEFIKSRAGVCIVHPDSAVKAPAGMALLLTEEPYRGYARVADLFYPVLNNQFPTSNQALIDPCASIGESCHIGVGATIGASAEIGKNCSIGPNASIGKGCVIGDDCAVGPNASLTYCIIGARVIVHTGASIGQDGFGFALGPEEHLKVPQLGRVVIEDDVEIGANTTIDRGTGPDTVIGAGTKIDNLVQIAHNVRVGKGCVIVSQVGISGSTVIGDFVMMGGQAGLTGHLKIGNAAQIAAQSGVMRDIDPGVTVGGSPAKPMRDWLKEVATIERLVKKKEN